jgi:hypothetical protein
MRLSHNNGNNLKNQFREGGRILAASSAIRKLTRPARP